MDADVSWGDVEWEDDPFEDLTCGDSDPIMVADHVDICDMFDTEVGMATGKGWKPDVVFNSGQPGRGHVGRRRHRCQWPREDSSRPSGSTTT